MIVDDSLMFNLIQDFRKKDIHPVARAQFLHAYLTHRKISQRQLAKELNIPHSTLQDWFSYNNITGKEYDELTDKGLGHKEIYRLVRDDRKHAKENIFKTLTRGEIDIILLRTITELKPYIYNTPTTTETLILIKELKNIMNRIELHIERG